MGAMRYALTASERAFKASVREFADRASRPADDGGFSGPGAGEAWTSDLGRWLSASRPGGLSRVEEVVALEEISRRCPAAAPELVACGMFKTLGPGLCRAAARLGAAQGALSRGIARLAGSRGPAPAFLQDVADAATGIEAARLKLYRAAILEDAGKASPEESLRAELSAEALAREAGGLSERIGGGNDEP